MTNEQHASVLRDYAKNCPDKIDGGPGIEESLCAGASALLALSDARELVALVNTIWTKDRDGRAAKRLAAKRMEVLARQIASAGEPLYDYTAEDF